MGKVCCFRDHDVWHRPDETGMNKVMAVFVLLFLVFGPAGAPVPRKTVDCSVDTRRCIKRESYKNQTPSAGLIAVSYPAKPPSTQAHGNEEGDSDLKHPIQITQLPAISLAETPKTIGDRIFDWGPWVFNFLLVVVGSLQAVYVIKTLIAIERQALLMERQANIQVASLQPWLRLGRSTCSSQSLPVQFGGVRESVYLTLSYEIVNPTSTPVRLQAIKWFISKEKRGPRPVWEMSGEETREILIPPDKEGNTPYLSMANIKIEGIQQVELFLSYHLPLEVRGEITFLNIEGSPVLQTFPHLAICGEGHLSRNGLLTTEDAPNQTVDYYDPD